MAKDIEYRIKGDASDAERAFKDVGRAAKTAGKDVEQSFDDVESAGDQARQTLVELARVFDTELRDAATAAEKLGQALGPELTGRMNVEDIVLDLNKMGVSFDEITADADKFAATLKEVDGIRLQQVNDGLGDTGTKMRAAKDETDRLSDSARGANSALANMVGNTAQDLGEVGGLVGSVGVGIGQMAEYAADATLAGESLTSSLLSMAQVVGPIAALSAAMALLNQFMSGRKLEQQFNADTMRAYADAVDDVGAGIAGVTQKLQAAGRLQLVAGTGPFGLGFGQQIKDVTELFARYGIGVDTVARVVAGSQSDFELFQQGLIDAGVPAEDLVKILAAMQVEMEGYDAAVKLAASGNEVFATTVDSANAGLQNVLDQLDPFRSFGDQWNQIMSDIADGNIGMAETARAIQDIHEGLGLEEDAIISLAQQRLDEKAQADADALQAEADAADELARQLDDTNDELRLMAATFDESASRADAFSGALDDINSQVDGLSLVSGAQTMSDFAGSIDGVVDALDALPGSIDDLPATLVPDTWAESLDLTDEQKALLDALSGMADQVQTEMGKAFEQGGDTRVREWAADTRQAITDQLHEAGVTSQAEIDRILGLLGLLDEDVTITIQLATAEQARNILAGIAGQIEKLPDEVQMQIAVLSATGKPEDALAALQIAIDALQDQGINVPVTIDDQGQIDVTADALDAATAPRTAGVAVDDDGTVQDFSNDADTATEDRTTHVIVPKSPSLGQMEELINTVARDRTVTFNPKSPGLGAMEALLNHVARFREAKILAEVLNGAQAEGTLNHIARDRTADIFVRTHGAGAAAASVSAIPGVSATAAPTALGATPTAVAAPSAVTMVAPAPTAHNTFNVTLQAGVIGNRFEVQRAVRKALRESTRLTGSRN